MSQLDRRQIFLALAALAAAPVAQAAALLLVAPEGARRIGQAYLAQHARALDAARLAADLLPQGWTPQAGARLKARAARDFRENRLFTHRGWRLSDTEGRLFALAALTPG
jgi:hypothetical protein